MKQDMKALTTYAWVDKNKGVVRIPITEAMQLTVAELAQKSPAPANPIACRKRVRAAPAAASPAPSASASASGTPKPTAVSGPDSANRSQPAAANNPPPAPPATQPGPSTSSRFSAVGRGQGASVTFRFACTFRAGNALAGSRENAMSALQPISPDESCEHTLRPPTTSPVATTRSRT